MKKIIVLMLASMLLLVGCGSSDTNENEEIVQQFRDSLSVFDDLQAVDATFTMTDVVNNEQTSIGILNIKAQDITSPQLMKLNMSVDLDGEVMKMYIVDGLSYVDYMGLKMGTPYDEAASEVDFGELFDNDDIEESIDGIKEIEAKDFEISEKDGITTLKIDSDYVKYLSSISEITDELDPEAEDINLSSASFLMKDGKFYGLELSGFSKDDEKTEMSMAIIFNAYNDEVDFDFPNFDEFVTFEN